MSEDTTRKARGMYNRIYGCDRAFYEYIMQEKSFIKSLEKFTIKELSYLSDLYENKISKLKNRSDMDNLNSSEVLAIAISIKLKTVVKRRKIDINKYRFSKDKLDQKQMAAARKKLDDVFKDARKTFWDSVFPEFKKR